MLPKSHGDSSYWISGGAVLQIDFNELKKEDCRTVARRLGLEINRQDKARCFLHVGDKNPSLQVYADGWKCFGCGEHGDAVDLVARYRGISNIEAAEWMKQEFDIQGPPKKQDYGQVEREHIYPGGQIKKAVYRRADGSKYACWFHMEGGAWEKGRGKSAPLLYPSSDNLATHIFLVEGEKDVDTWASQQSASQMARTANGAQNTRRCFPESMFTSFRTTTHPAKSTRSAWLPR